MRQGAILLWLLRRPAAVAVLLLASALFAGHRLYVAVRARVVPAPAPRVGYTLQSPNFVPDEVLIHARPGRSGAVDAALRLAGGTMAIPVRNTGLVRLKLPAGRAVLDAVNSLLGDPDLEWAEPNYIVQIARVPEGPRFEELWGMRNVGRTFRSRACGTIPGTKGADLDAEHAWDKNRGSRKVIVAVIDTGIDYTHPNLKDNVWTNPGEIPDNGKDDDGNGYIDDVHGYDFINGKGDPLDDHGHGTHCAGTIGAANKDASGVVGVNWEVQLMALKFLDANGFGSISAACEAIAYARTFGVPITSNSWGGLGYSRSLYEEIKKSPSLFVAAAGNSSMDGDTVPFYPSGYDLPNILSVAASDPQDRLGCFSNYGQTTVDVAAPGVAILSTLPTYPCTLTRAGFKQGYDYLDGTSMATPHAAGAAGLLLSAFGDESGLQRRHRMIATAKATTGLVERCVANGRVDLFTALSTAKMPPIAEAGPDTAAPPGWEVKLNAGGSQPYPGRSIATYVWSESGKQLRRSPRPEFAYKSDQKAIHQIQLDVVDDQGATGRDLVSVTVADQVMTGASLALERHDRRTLWITLAVQDVATKKPVADAEVEILLVTPGGWTYTSVGRTDKQGQFRTEWQGPGRLPAGRYEARLRSLRHGTYVWDRKQITASWEGK